MGRRGKVSQTLDGGLVLGADTGLLGTNDPGPFLKLPVVTTAQRTAITASDGLAEGLVVYDSSLGKIMAYQAGGWGSVDGTAASSLDAAYNGGATVTVDAADVLLNLNDSSNDYGLVIDCAANGTIAKALEITTAGGASAVFTTALDVSDAGIVNAIDIGANAIAGTNFSVDASGNVTAVAVTASGTAGLADVTVSSTLAVTGAVTAASTYTGQGAMILDVDAAEAFLIRENGDAADVVTVDTTQDAADTTFKVSSKTTSGKAFFLDVDTTTGQGLDIDASTVTSGDALRIVVASGTMTAAGSAISVLDGSTEVFAVRDDGSIYSKATAEGTDALTIDTGDVTITDGDLVVSGGEVALTSNANAAGLVLVNNTITTANSFVDVSSTSITTGALMRLNANTAAHDGEVLEIISAGDTTSTPVGLSVTIANPTTGAARGIEVTMAGATTTAKGIAVTMDAITTGDMLYLDNGGGTMTNGSGYFINCNDDNTTKFGVSTNGNTTIAGTAAGTAALTLTTGDLVISDTDASTISSVNGTSTLLTLDNAGGAIADNASVLTIDSGGTPAAAGSNLLRVQFTGTDTNKPTLVEVVGGGKDAMGLSVDVDPTTTSAVYLTSGGVLAADKGTLEVVSSVAACNADSQVVRIQQGSTTGANVPLGVLQADVSEPLVLFESAAASGAAIDLTNTTPAAVAGSILVSLNGTDYRIAAYAAAGWS